MKTLDEPAGSQPIFSEDMETPEPINDQWKLTQVVILSRENRDFTGRATRLNQSENRSVEIFWSACLGFDDTWRLNNINPSYHGRSDIEFSCEKDMDAAIRAALSKWLAEYVSGRRKLKASTIVEEKVPVEAKAPQRNKKRRRKQATPRNHALAGARADIARLDLLLQRLRVMKASR